MNKKGTTLLELLVAVSIFVVVITMALNIGQSIIESLRNAVSAQLTQENVRFALEVMSKEMRNARIMNNDCDGAFKDIKIDGKRALGLGGDYSATNKVFNIDSNNSYGKNILMFRNKEGECVSYSFYPDLESEENESTNIIMITRSKIIPEEPETYRHSIGAITSGLISVRELVFLIKDDIIGAFHTIQPRATVKMTVEMESSSDKHKHTIDIQTTVSSRYYE